jgi:hypothetical protein
MNLESARPGVALVAASERADKWFFAGVSQRVCLQMSLRNEVLVAALTPEWTLASVCPHMRLEVTSLGKFFKTGHKRTQEQFCLCFWTFDC